MPTISLRTGLDRDILQIVKKLEDDGMKKPNVWKVYEAIQQSNSSLRRQKKKILEDSIDRVIEFRKQEAADEDDSDAEVEAAMARSGVVTEERFLLNKQITRLWQVNNNARTDKPASEEPEASKPTRKRKRDEDGVRNGTKSDTEQLASAGQSDNVKSGLSKKARNRPYTIVAPAREPPLGGVDAIRSDLQKVMKCSMHSHDTFPQGHFGKDNGILVIGSAGAGKKTLIQAIAASLDRPLVQLQDRCFIDPDKVEKNLADVLDEARALAPCIVLIDGMHRHMSRPSKSSQGDLHGRCVAEFRQLMNRVAAHSLDSPPILMVATTTQVEDIDPHALALFKRMVRIPLPDQTAREEILRVAAHSLTLAQGFDFASHARSTHGFVARELDQVLVNAVTALGVRRLEENEELAERGDAQIGGPLVVTNEAVAASISNHIPQSRQEGFSTVPSTTWSEVGALLDVRRHLEQLIVEPIRNPGRYVHWGIGRSAGVLLYGPPGCGKTLLAKAVANEAQAAFISISGPELLNKYVGESERAVRELFTRARAAAPCIVFFDEMESLVPNRQSSSTDAGVRVVNTLLTELDGMKERTGVYVIGTTNRPDMIDPAILRPGRLETKILVDLPNEGERVDILRAIVRTRIRNVSESDMTCLEQVARDKRCTGFSGADLMGLYKEAAMHVLSGGRDIPAPSPSDGRMVDDGAWDYALQRSRPSVRNPEEYRALAKNIS